MKLLSDKDNIEKLYGKISINFLLIQDFVAILALMGISAFEKGIWMEILFTISRAIILILVLILFTRYILYRITDFLVSYQEFLFLFLIVWGLELSFLFRYIGLSMEMGALIVGVLLSTTLYSYAIASKLKVLRDFSIIIFFFVFLGSQLGLQELSKVLPLPIGFSLFILIIKPFVLMVLRESSDILKKQGF